MGKIVISTNVSLDGVVQDPDGGEGFRLGGWFVQDGARTSKSGARSSTPRLCAPRPCCWAGAATSGSPLPLRRRRPAAPPRGHRPPPCAGSAGFQPCRLGSPLKVPASLDVLSGCRSLRSVRASVGPSGCGRPDRGLRPTLPRRQGPPRPRLHHRGGQALLHRRLVARCSPLSRGRPASAGADACFRSARLGSR
jgi:hypothetical protein